MLALKYLLMIFGVALFGSAGALVVYDVYLSEQLRRLLARNKTNETGGETEITARRPFGPVRWRLAQQLAIAGVLPLLLALSIVAMPDGAAGVRIGQIWGAWHGTLYMGVHFVTPLVDRVARYDTRERVYSTAANTSLKTENAEAAAQAKIIDSCAEVERQRNLSDAEANRIRVTAAADAERMKFEASVLKQNPTLIQKIIAERLSDKLQIMTVPMHGKKFLQTT